MFHKIFSKCCLRQFRTVLSSLGLVALLCGGCGLQIMPEVRYLILGDSITGTIDTDTYPRFLIAQRGDSVSLWAIDGLGGRTAAQGLQALQSIIENGQYPNNTALLYFLGGADVIDFVSRLDPGLAFSPTEEGYPFSDEFNLILRSVEKNASNALASASDQEWELYVITYPSIPTGILPCDAFGGNELNESEAARANEYIKQLNDTLSDVAEEYDASVIDLSEVDSQLQGDSENYTDCIHPSELGAQIIASQLSQMLPL